MNKICTDLIQSRRLIELGINIDTADMHYMYRHWEINENTRGEQKDASIGFDSDFYHGADNGKTYHYIPAWSLTALEKLMPFQLIENNNRFGFYQVKGFNKQGETYRFGYKSNDNSFLFETSWHNDPIDAAVEMIIWLKENEKIKLRRKVK